LVINGRNIQEKGASPIQVGSHFISTAEEATDMSLQKQIGWFLADDQGAELAEYAVAVALLVAVGVVVYSTLGAAINDSNNGTATKVTDAASSTFPF
jgi:Flp pilus assembly pilin Flp